MPSRVIRWGCPGWCECCGTHELLSYKSTKNVHDACLWIRPGVVTGYCRNRYGTRGLRNRIRERDRAEAELQKAHDTLEVRVEERTAELKNEIEEHKQAELRLKESEEKYRSMMESMNDPAYICSPDFHVEYMNPAMVKRTGRDATGEPCYKAINELDEKCPWCVSIKCKKMRAA